MSAAAIMRGADASSITSCGSTTIGTSVSPEHPANVKTNSAQDTPPIVLFSPLNCMKYSPSMNASSIGKERAVVNQQVYPQGRNLSPVGRIRQVSSACFDMPLLLLDYFLGTTIANDHIKMIPHTNNNGDTGMIITTENMVKRFSTEEGETTALGGVNIQVAESEFVSSRGPSGCGKSSLLNIIGLIDSPDSGKFFFLGEDISRYNERQRAILRK